MKVIVCGAGQVGFNIAKHLADQQNDVTVIDRSPDLIRKISESLDVQALVDMPLIRPCWTGQVPPTRNSWSR